MPNKKVKLEERLSLYPLKLEEALKMFLDHKPERKQRKAQETKETQKTKGAVKQSKNDKPVK